MINQNKTHCIFIGNRQLLSRIPNITTVKFDGNTNTPSNHVKNLGNYIHRNTTFDVHVNEANKKVLGSLTYVKRSSENFQKTTRVIIESCLVLSLISYCIRIWGTRNETLPQSDHKAQNFAVKVAVGWMKKNMIIFFLV